jgi:uncharacterized protein (DUF58 family)
MMKVNWNGILRFGVIFTINGYLWWYFRSYLNFMIAILLLAALIVSIGLTVVYAKKLEAEIQMPSGRVSPETDFSFGLAVKNPVKFLFFTCKIRYEIGNVFIETPKQKTVRIQAAPADTAKELYMMRSRYCGMIQAGIREFFVEDLFHVIWVSNTNCRDGQVLVYPADTDEAETAVADLISGFSLDEESQERGIDYNPDYELREYIPGDDLKAIHWKLTAKQGNLMVRQRLSSGRNKVNVVLELEQSAQENDMRIHALNSICKKLLSLEYPVELYWWSYADRQMRSRLFLEEGELERTIGEILGTNSVEEKSQVRQMFELEKGNVPYVFITSGALKGEYIRHF